MGCVFGRGRCFPCLFGAVLGLVLVVRACYPVGINTPPLFLGGLFGGRCYPTLPSANFFCLGKKVVVDKGAKGDFFVKRG